MEGKNSLGSLEKCMHAHTLTYAGCLIRTYLAIFLFFFFSVYVSICRYTDIDTHGVSHIRCLYVLSEDGLGLSGHQKNTSIAPGRKETRELCMSEARCCEGARNVLTMEREAASAYLSSDTYVYLFFSLHFDLSINPSIYHLSISSSTWTYLSLSMYLYRSLPVFICHLL